MFTGYHLNLNLKKIGTGDLFRKNQPILQKFLKAQTDILEQNNYLKL